MAGKTGMVIGRARPGDGRLGAVPAEEERARRAALRRERGKEESMAERDPEGYRARWRRNARKARKAARAEDDPTRAMLLTLAADSWAALAREPPPKPGPDAASREEEVA